MLIREFINKYIVAYKNYKEIWIKINKLSKTPELSSPLGSAKLKLVEKVCYSTYVKRLNAAQIFGYAFLEVYLITRFFNHKVLPLLIFIFELGSQRRTKKVVHHQEVNEDKKLKSTIKKFGKLQVRINREFLLFLHVMIILIAGIF